MLAQTNNDEGHSSQNIAPSEPYDIHEDTDDIFDNEPLILSQSQLPAGNKRFVAIFDHF